MSLSAIWVPAGKRITTLACALMLFVPAVPASAQFLTAFSLLEGPFTLHENASGLQSSLLSPFSAPLNDVPYWVSLGFDFSNTVRTTQGNKHVGDLYGNGQHLHSLALLGRQVRLETYLSRFDQHGLLIESDQKRTEGDIHAGTAAARITMPIGRVQATLGFGVSGGHADIASQLLSDTLPIFASAPRVHARLESQKVSVGVLSALTSYLSFEATVAREQTPGAITLSGQSHSGATQVSLPLDASGWGWNLTLRAAPDRRTQVFVYWQQTDVGGKGMARRDRALALGTSTTSARDSEWGMAIRHRFGGTGTAGLFTTYTVSRFDTHAFGLDPVPLGFRLQDVDRVGYYLNGMLHRREFGALWEQHFSRGHELLFHYSWIELPLSIAYGYEGANFLFGTTRGSQLDLPYTRGHLIQLRYTLPARPLFIALDLSQVIPMPVPHHGSTPVTPPPPSLTPRREASGGWTVSLSLIYPLP